MLRRVLLPDDPPGELGEPILEEVTDMVFVRSPAHLHREMRTLSHSSDDSSLPRGLSVSCACHTGNPPHDTMYGM